MNRRREPEPPDPDEDGAIADELLRSRVEIKLRGMIAEADLRGMTPVAVLFEWLDELSAAEPERARQLLGLMPAATRVLYGQWRNAGRGEGPAAVQ